MGEGTFVCVLGAPGSAKAQHCKQASEGRPGWSHISVGELLRGEAWEDAEQETQCREKLNLGENVDDELVLAVLQKRVKGGDAENFLIDGFPQSIGQAEEFEKQIGQIETVVVVEAPEDALRNRLAKIAETSELDQDKIDIVEKKFANFEAKVKPTIEALRGQGKITSIQTDGSTEQIIEGIKGMIEKISAAKEEVVAADKANENEDKNEETNAETPIEEEQVSVDAPSQPDGEGKPAEISDLPPETEEAPSGDVEPAEVTHGEAENSGPAPVLDVENSSEGLEVEGRPEVSKEAEEGNEQEEALDGSTPDAGEEMDDKGCTGQELEEGIDAANAQQEGVEEMPDDVEGADGGEMEAEMVEAATKIQSVQRGRKARQEVHNMKETRRIENEKSAAAATKIQAVQRGRTARKEVNELRASQRMEMDRKQQAATKIQSAQRGRQARKEVQGIRYRREQETLKKENAAKKIQAVQRGRTARKEVNEMKETKARECKAKKEEQAAVQIQAVQRGRQARKEVAELRATRTMEKVAGEEQSKSNPSSPPPLAKESSSRKHRKFDENRVPVRQYMDATVVPVLREGLHALNKSRPSDPLQFLSDYLLESKKRLATGED